MAKRKYTIIAKAFDAKRNLISTGCNSYTKTHPLQSHFAKLAGEPARQYLHAELQALIRCKDKLPVHLSIERYDSEGNPVLAKPCRVCNSALKAFGVKSIRYTTKDGVKHESIT